MPFFNRGRIKLNKTFFNSFGSGGGPIPPLPPIRPNSYLKYTFSQRDLTAAITDRVSNSDILTTTIGTDVNAVQTIDGGIRTFEFGENLIPFSEDFTSAGGWNANRATVQSNVGIAPDGTLTADGVFPNSDSNTHFINEVLAVPLQVFNGSLFIKDLGAGYATLRLRNSNASNIGLRIDLSSGAVLESDSAANNIVVDSVGDGWYRLSFSIDFLAASGNTIFFAYPASATSDNYQGNPSEGIQVWGAQISSGTSVDNYIKTEGNPVFRYQQAFDVGVGALIEHSAVTQIPTDMTLWDDSGNSTSTYNAATEENRWTFDGGNQPHRFFTNSSVTEGLDYIMSVEFKKEESQFVQIAGSTGFQNFAINYDLVNGLANQVTSFSTVKDFGLIDIGDSYIIYAVAESNNTLQGRMILSKADSLNTLRVSATSDSGAFTVKYPNFVQSSALSSPISAPFGAAQRDASTPQVTGTAIPDSRVSVFTEFIANADNPATNPVNIAELQFTNDNIVIGYTYDEVLPLFLANSFFVTNPTGDFVIEYTPDQVIQKGDQIKIDLYINDVSVALAYENKTNGEKGILQNTSVFLDLGVGDIIKLGETDALSANYMTMVDFEVTAYTAPVIPDFADNGDFAQNGDFA